MPEPKIDFDGTRFEVRVPNNSPVSIKHKRQAVTDWYVEKATETLPSRSDRYIDKLGLADVDIEVQTLQRRWGEYRPGEVVLHWRLILAPRKIQDYVVEHELAHFRHEAHSDAFWNTVGTLVPDYRERREWLRVNGATLTI